MATAGLGIQPVGGGRRVALDGLRGLAALAVLLFHLIDCPHRGYLAVDLFFLLSGYVVAGAYGARLEGGASFGWFLGVRMARIYPLYVAGMMLNFCLWLGPRPAQAVAALAGGLGFIPFAVASIPRAYPLDGPTWSLALEMGINILFGLGGWRLSNRALALICAVAGLCLTACILHAGSADIGLRPGWSDYGGGVARVFFGFPLGVLFHRLHQAGRLPRLAVRRDLVLVALLALVFAPWASAALDGVAILVVLPALFLLMLNLAEPSGREAVVCTWGGRLSYPLYTLHLPFVFAAEAWARTLGLPALPFVLAVVFCVAVAAHLTIEPWGRRAIEALLRARRGRGAPLTQEAEAASS